jgi:hypothetical protein
MYPYATVSETGATKTRWQLKVGDERDLASSSYIPVSGLV